MHIFSKILFLDGTSNFFEVTVHLCRNDPAYCHELLMVSWLHEHQALHRVVVKFQIFCKREPGYRMGEISPLRTASMRQLRLGDRLQQTPPALSVLHFVETICFNKPLEKSVTDYLCTLTITNRQGVLWGRLNQDLRNHSAKIFFDLF